MSRPQNIHFIAIGGSIMHNLAIALHKKGNAITGSDDELFEPSRSLLLAHGLLPPATGWDVDKIHPGLDAVILGMHARQDNPELLKARDLGLKIYSFPDYIYEQSKDKQRIVIGGSHGKTTITSMIIHVLNFLKRDFDYAVGARIEGFREMVRLSDAPIIVIEGDEYLSSPIDKTPKLLKYHHHIGLISGIAWDHINVFPTEEVYLKPFEDFADATPKAGTLIYCEEDPAATRIGKKGRSDANETGYGTHPHTIENGRTYLKYAREKIPVNIFGKHNLQNVNAAKVTLLRIGVSEDDFYAAIRSFKGADKRLEVVAEKKDGIIYKDFAHAPSKVLASVRAVKEQYPNRHLTACLELHTFSSLNKDFLHRYHGTMKDADTAVVFYNPETVIRKKLTRISKEDIRKYFGQPEPMVFDRVDELIGFLRSQNRQDSNLLLMTSGTFDGLDYSSLPMMS